MTDDAVPPGKLKSVITYLEMRQAPRRLRVLPPARKLALLRAESPTAAFYRYLYNTVGEPWLWCERRALDDAALKAIIHDPKVEIYVLYAGGVPAGYAELDLRRKPDIELAYLGLIPEFIGQGLGAYLLHWSVDTAWQHAPARLWTHICNFDHPRTLAVFQRAGFTPYKQEIKIIDDPRLKGLIPPHVTTTG